MDRSGPVAELLEPIPGLAIDRPSPLFALFGKRLRARNHLRASLLLLAALGSVGCQRAGSPRPAAGPIVLIVVDTLRADHVSCYGYPRPTMPEACQLARDGVTFERAFATRTSTTPSIASMLTGLYPHRHGVRLLYLLLPQEVVTLPEILREQGYRTGGFISSFVMVRDFSGFDQGFEVYDDYVQTKELVRENYERHAPDTMERVIPWLESAGPRTFLFVHLIEPHGPYAPPQPFLEQFALPSDGKTTEGLPIPMYQRIPGLRFVNEFIGRYDGEIASVDHQIGRLLEHLRKRGWYDSALIILVADHGEAMGEGGRWFVHGKTVQEAEARVPLLVKFPAGGRPAPPPGTRIRRPVSALDIFRTVLGAAGQPAPSQAFGGTDLLEVANTKQRKGPPPLTELANQKGLWIAAHGTGCSVRWRFARSRLDGKHLLRDAGQISRWRRLGAESIEPGQKPRRDCPDKVARTVDPLVRDLLTHRSNLNPVSRKEVKQRPGGKTSFVTGRAGPSIPLQEHEREALRALGYLE
jgi:arylsulfatase A-like enzyme